MVLAQETRSPGNGARHHVHASEIRAFFHAIPPLGYAPAVMVRVVEVEPGTELLTAVQDLWRGHSDTLGYMPEGGFEDHARNKWILAAVTDSGDLMGYVLYRTTHRRQAAIAQLCVNPNARGQGVARILFDAVRKRVSKNCNDILVCCRRDFGAHSLWPELGFVAVREQPGRRKDTTKTTFRYELSLLPLFAIIEERRDADAMPVVIDANIFFDLDDEVALGREESKALQADWLSEFVELCVTDEILNEINRANEPSQRARQRSRVEQFRLLPTNKVREDQVTTELQQRFQAWTSDSGRSDIRQLAKAIAAGATYFVTRDGLVREQAEELDERFGLIVVSPFELVLQFDELRRADEYRPKRFISVGLKAVKPRDADGLERVADLLHVGQPFQRPRRHTLSLLRDMLASPSRFDLTYINDNGGNMMAAYGVERPAPDLLRLPLFAVAGSALGRTAARHFAEKMTMLAAAEHRKVVEVHGEAGGQRIEEALVDAGFSKEGDRWVKLVLPVLAGAEEVAAEVARIGSQHPVTQDLVNRLASYLQPGGGSESAEGRPETLARVERALWPAKLLGTGLPCFIVPIQPSWAQHLFDVNLAERTLFGADPQLAMNSENAYYRAAKPAILTAPGRVLWYVSQDSAYHGSMALRACSYLDEVIVARPKDAYRRFQRLGVYAWRDVFQIAGGDINKEIMAFRFTKTELLNTPVPWARLQDVLRRHGKASQFQSPTKITEACFLELYQLGMGGA